jgi:hypothetical protein
MIILTKGGTKIQNFKGLKNCCESDHLKNFILDYAYPLVFTLALNTYARFYAIIQNILQESILW